MRARASRRQPTPRLFRFVPLVPLALFGALVASSSAGCDDLHSDGAATPSDASASSDSPTTTTSDGADASPIQPPNGDDAAPTSTSDAASATDASSDVAIDSAIPSLPGWTLTWSDEFNLPDGSAVDSTKWTQETGNDGWSSNHEREYYTPGTANAVIQGGALVITATPTGASQYTCQYGACEYTSARLNTAGKFEQAYGRFEARIKITRGQGVWPAWWILGDNIGSVGWPQCGEVDIMENIGSTPSTNYGSLHGPGYSGAQDLTGSYSLADGGILADDFHEYAAEWEQNVVRFYLDGVNYETRTPADVPAGDAWVYDHPFFVILNVAVGGYWPGDPDGTTPFPQAMTVDYVRVYSKTP